jgi:hypothetical protein
VTWSAPPRIRVLTATLGSLGLSLVAAATTLAAEPGTTPETGGDPRSPGQGPGLVGDPLFAIGVVVLVALISIGLTFGYVRLTGSRGGSRPD